MNICVIGSSASAGQGLDDRSDAWPWLVGARLAEVAGEPVQVQHALIYAYTPDAVDRAIRVVETSQADLIIYVCFASSIRTVANRVRKLFGVRAYRFFRRAEARFEAGPAGGAKQATRANRTARWLARHVIGTEPHAPLAAAVRGQVAVVDALARYEDAIVLVYFCPEIPRALARSNPGADAYWASLRAAVEAAANRHRFLVVDGEPAYAAHPDRDDRFYQADLLHRTPEGHRIEAEVILDALLAPPSPYARAAGMATPRR